MADYYEILGVTPQATTAEVRQAYLRIARERHPDRFSDPEEKARAQDLFKDATAAFNTLSNERSRREYDEERAKPKLSTPEEIARDAYARGLQMLEAKDYHEAVQLLRTAVEFAPQDPRCHAALARALAKNPNWLREAIQSLEKAAELGPRQAAYHAELAELYHGQGLKLRARKALDKALELGPQDPGVQRVAQLLERATEEAGQ